MTGGDKETVPGHPVSNGHLKDEGGLGESGGHRASSADGDRALAERS